MYKRILLKLSGEALKDKDGKQILNVDYLKDVASTIKLLHDHNIQIAVVIGAGNIWRGKLANEIGIEHVQADFMGMLGTVINAVAVSSSLKNLGVESVVYSSLPEIAGVTSQYKKESAIKSLEEGKVIFLSGGTGKPFFTTDTAASILALDIKAEAILMGKNGVDGVYTCDPILNPNAQFIKNISFEEMIKNNLQIMDISAIKLLKDSDIVIRIFNMSSPSNFVKVSLGEDIGTIIKKGE